VKFLVEVRSDHIREGERNDPERCPVSYAIWDATGIHFDIEQVVARLPGQGSWALPVEARRFVVAFDSGERVEPIRFEFDLGPIPLYAFQSLVLHGSNPHDRRNRDRRAIAAAS
jgi:hypothetical protein